MTIIFIVIIAVAIFIGGILFCLNNFKKVKRAKDNAIDIADMFKKEGDEK